MKKVFQWCGIAVLSCLLGQEVCPAQSNLMVTTVVGFNQTNGSYPFSQLTQGNDGMLYGTTSSGGAFGLGTVFKTSLDGALTTLVSFDGTNGANPMFGVVSSADATVYGVGSSNVFQLTSNGVISTLLTFTGSNGYNPSSLIMAQDGNLYGTTISGGVFTNVLDYGLVGFGSVFKLATNGDFALLSSFNGTNGARARSIMQAADGNFYGVTAKGGTYDLGTVFRMTPGGEVTTLVSFDGTNGNSPWDIMQAGDGCLYGTTDQGGTNFGSNPFGSTGFGTIFKLTTNGDFASLGSFNESDGAYPRGKLLEVSNGVFWATTYMGGPSDYGTLFQVTTNGTITPVIAFYASGIALPVSGLMRASDGMCYGLSQYFANTGVLYSVRPVEIPVVTSSVQGNQMVLNWRGFGGCQYLIESKNSLNDANWLFTAGKKPSTNGIISFAETIVPGTQKFYKVSLSLPKYH